jgi:hypothetical protein
MSIFSITSYTGLHYYVLQPLTLLGEWMGYDLHKAPTDRLSALFALANTSKAVLGGLEVFDGSESAWNNWKGSRSLKREHFCYEKSQLIRKDYYPPDSVTHVWQRRVSLSGWLNAACSFVEWLKQKDVIRITSPDLNTALNNVGVATLALNCIAKLFLARQEYAVGVDSRNGPVPTREYLRRFLTDGVVNVSGLAVAYFSSSLCGNAAAGRRLLYWSTVGSIASWGALLLSMPVPPEPVNSRK